MDEVEQDLFDVEFHIKEILRKYDVKLLGRIILEKEEELRFIDGEDDE